MKDIAIYGAGGFGREVLTIIKAINSINPQWNMLGFFDDSRTCGECVNGFPILGGIDRLNEWNNDLSVVVAIGSPMVKQKIVRNITNPHIHFPTLIHPSVIIGDTHLVDIGKGCIICAGNILTTNIVIGDFVILNLACTVGHDAVIHSFAAFMPSCNISGEVRIGEGVYCGTGVKIINQISIGSHTIVGAGAVVTSNQPDNCTVVGVPAKVIKRNN